MSQNSLDKKNKGAWLINHSSKLDHIVASYDLENIQESGKIGKVLGTLAGSEQITMPKKQAEALAKANGVSSLEFRTIIQDLTGNHLIEESDGEIICLGLTTTGILAHTADIFDSKTPSNQEKAILHLSELASNAPVESKRVSAFLQDTYKLSNQEISETLKRSEDCSLIEFADLEDTERLYFNGALFKTDSPQKIQKILTSISTEEQRKVTDIQTLLRTQGCIEEAKVIKELGQQLFDKILHVGLIEICEVSNSHEKIQYVVSPSAFNKYGNSFVEDAFDHAKALVASLRYGMTKSSVERGQIRALSALMRKLISGASVGPAPAIGQDYKVLEYKGVLKIDPVGYGSYCMKLLKKEVGEIALKILTQGDASEMSLLNMPSASLVSFSGPEQQRDVFKKKQIDVSQKKAHELLRAIRTGGNL